MKTSLFIGFALMSLSLVSRAENTPSLEWGGYFDFYYQSSPQGHVVSTGGPRVVEGRYFDRNVNQMTLNMAELSLKKNLGKVSLKTDFAFGEMVDQMSGGTTAASESTRNITQAILTYTFNDRLVINVGKFYSPVGFEGVKAKDNWQYSRSYLYNYGTPVWYQGFNLNYVVVPKKFAAAVYVVNAWDGRISQEQNESSTVGLNLNFTGLESLVVNYNYLGGAEASNRGLREIHELNATYNFNEKYAMGVDGLVGSQKEVALVDQAKWNAYAFYFKAALSEVYTISPRYEVFDDSDNGFAIAGGLSSVGAKQKITSMTLTNTFNLGDGLETRFEVRSDKSDTVDNYTQQSYALALLYSL